MNKMLIFLGIKPAIKGVEYSRLTGMWFVRINGYCTEAKYTYYEAREKFIAMCREAA